MNRLIAKMNCTLIRPALPMGAVWRHKVVGKHDLGGGKLKP